MPKPGDVYAVKHPRGFHGAVRVLRRRGGEFLVACSTYLDRKSPVLTDPRIRKVERQTRITFEGEPSMSWMSGRLPPTLRLIGSIAPSVREARRDSNFWGDWRGVGIDAWWAWRFRHEPAKFERELNAEADRERRMEIARLRRQRPKAMMAEREFWALIALIDHGAGDGRKKLVPLVRALATQPVTDIRRFHERLAERLFRLDTRVLARRLRVVAWRAGGAGFSPDGFLYARCGCVARGRDFYLQVRRQPGRVSKCVELEQLLDVARWAHRRKTGKSFDYWPGLSYESCSNLAGWPE